MIASHRAKKSAPKLQNQTKESENQPYEGKTENWQEIWGVNKIRPTLATPLLLADKPTFSLFEQIWESSANYSTLLRFCSVIHFCSSHCIVHVTCQAFLQNVKSTTTESTFSTNQFSRQWFQRIALISPRAVWPVFTCWRGWRNQPVTALRVLQGPEPGARLPSRKSEYFQCFVKVFFMFFFCGLSIFISQFACDWIRYNCACSS